ncbi:MAG: Hsp20/alpha crystallin family protein [Candidatus Omnitrophica bacterium]|nr:Hsp20/alpha crystallin family protein [Candidatus Omnitrophota bacterium]
MKHKIMLWSIVILAGALIFENAYLFGRYGKEKERVEVYSPYHPGFVKKLPAQGRPVFYDSSLRDSFSEMNRMQGKMNRAFRENMMPNPPAPVNDKLFGGSGMIFSNTDTTYILKVAMPGVDKNEIELKVQGRQLVISSRSKTDKDQKGKDSYRRELSYGDFLSYFTLPNDAQVGKITSGYKDGVLTVVIPRSKKIKNRPAAFEVPVR